MDLYWRGGASGFQCRLVEGFSYFVLFFYVFVAWIPHANHFFQITEEFESSINKVRRRVRSPVDTKTKLDNIAHLWMLPVKALDAALT